MSFTDTLEPWGKLDRQDKRQRLSLVGHCIDVAAVFTTLAKLPTMRRRLERLAGRPLADVDMQRLAVLAFLHDTGKAGAGFYSKGEPPEVVDAWRRRNTPNNEQWGHTRVVAPLIADDSSHDAHREALRLEEWAAWWPEAEQLWLAAVSHHGQPITHDTLPPSFKWPTWTAPIAGYEPLHGLRRLGEAVQRLWPEAFSAAPTAPLALAFTHAFAGLVSLADWIGSNTEHFPYELSGAQDEARWPAALDAAGLALRSIGLDLSAQQADFATRAPGFEDLFGFAAKPMQEAAGTRLEQTLVVLEAETGSGKTEAALWRFAQLFRIGAVDSLAFLLPTRVAASGIYARLETFVQRAFPDPALRPSWVLAVPGDLRANGVQGERAPGLAYASVLWPDGESRETLFWAAENSKRYFAAGLLAGTIDQFLLSTLRTGHAHLRAALSLRSLVVVDEVHASDPYMARLLRSALARHTAAGGHAMLLSATLTGAARSQLIANASLAELARADAPYPCLSHAAGLEDVDPASRSGKPAKRVQISTRDAMRDPAQVAGLVQSALQQGQRILVLRNTVGQALATQRALEALLGTDHPALFRVEGQAVLHHGRYARADRLLLDKAVALRFGKTAAKNLVPVVLVGTQTLEISVDCDADLLITDLVPMDVLLQRLGRLHRHGERHPLRPGGHALACAVVLTPQTRDLAALLQRGGSRGLGLGPNSAYPNLLAVEACWRELGRGAIWDIPLHNRALVEACCDEATLAALAQQLGGDWPAHMMELTGKALSQRSTAELVTLDWRRPWDEMAPGDLTGKARTRLGLDALPLDLQQRWTTALGQVLERLDVPAWMWGGEPQEMAITAFDASQAGELRFEAGGRRFGYSRFGLERLD